MKATNVLLTQLFSHWIMIFPLPCNIFLYKIDNWKITLLLLHFYYATIHFLWILMVSIMLPSISYIDFYTIFLYYLIASFICPSQWLVILSTTVRERAYFNLKDIMSLLSTKPSNTYSLHTEQHPEILKCPPNPDWTDSMSFLLAFLMAHSLTHLAS